MHRLTATITLSIAISLSLLSGCIIQTDKQGAADKIIEQFQAAIAQHHWDEAAKLYAPAFFKEQSRASWQQEIEQTEKLLGDTQSFAISAKSKDPRFSGDFYIYTVTVKHEHGYSTETITIVRNIDSDSLTIVGYQVKNRRIQ